MSLLVSSLRNYIMLILIARDITARLTFGVGTLMALPVNIPSNSGIALATALTAPVLVITMFKAALLPLLSPL